MNTAEIEINVMVSQCLSRRIDSIETVRSEVAAWQARRDRLQAKINWQFTTREARVKRKRLYSSTALQHKIIHKVNVCIVMYSSHSSKIFEKNETHCDSLKSP